MTQLIDPTTARQFEKLPPHSIESEICVLGSMMLDEKARAEAATIICRDDFYQADHQIIFDAIIRLGAKGNVDAVLIFEELIRTQLLEEVGGKAYIAQILNSVPSTAHAAQYAARVREHSLMRGLIDVSNDVLRRAYAGGLAESSAEIIDSAAVELARLSQATGRGESTKTIGAVVLEVRERFADIDDVLIPTGFAEIDKAIIGIVPGEFWLIGARPSMGKSLIAKQISIQAAKAGFAVALFSVEESRFKVGKNFISADAKIDNWRLRSIKGLGSDDWKAIHVAQEHADKIPVFVNDRLRTAREIRAECAALVARCGVKLVVVDYLQRVDAGGRTPYERATLASNALVSIANDLQVGMIVPVQLNRALETRDDKHPTISDLRDSGSLEQDADGIMLLHREDYFHASDRQYTPTGIAEVNIAKMRDGERGRTVALKANLKYQTFEDIEGPQMETPW